MLDPPKTSLQTLSSDALIKHPVRLFLSALRLKYHCDSQFVRIVRGTIIVFGKLEKVFTDLQQFFAESIRLCSQSGFANNSKSIPSKSARKLRIIAAHQAAFSAFIRP